MAFCLAMLLLGACTKQTPNAGATLQLTVAPGDRDADVWVDGNYVGTVGDLQGRATGPLKLAPGAHRVEVRKSGRFPVQRTVKVEAGGPSSVALEAELLEDPQ
ncbi:MAG TPA: hypothetical protein VG755_30505 [Nannocystaceae bacterium]|nr:hypothetical protein [Nannocystaceae bacterium]